ncbi:hypothetical protein GCM10025791_04270 [Halioxenophilus aromaticivorans]|uniref:Uncharacterized protein n=1 Tax=Halioxenophilus aromaticivorans TaxID=1306992 RepID=A0AAV3TY52_9ALTE
MVMTDIHVWSPYGQPSVVLIGYPADQSSFYPKAPNQQWYLRGPPVFHSVYETSSFYFLAKL